MIIIFKWLICGLKHCNLETCSYNHSIQLTRLKSISHEKYNMIQIEYWRKRSKANRFTLGRVDAEVNRDRGYLFSFPSQSIRLIRNFLSNTGCTTVQRDIIVSALGNSSWHHKKYIMHNQYVRNLTMSYVLVESRLSKKEWGMQGPPDLNFISCTLNYTYADDAMLILSSCHVSKTGKVHRDVWCDCFDHSG